MVIQYLLVNNDSPETTTEKLEQYSAILIWLLSLWPLGEETLK